MDAEKGNIFKMLNGDKQFIIPAYQRLYSWDDEQCSRLWADILNMEKNGKDSHFVGSIVCIAEKTAPTGVQKFMIIDGQQRMTTLTLILIALRDYAKKHSGETQINPEKIDDVFLKNKYETGDERYKLLLTEEDKQVLISLIESKPIPEGCKSKIIRAYNFFSAEIAKKPIELEKVYEATGKLLIVTITLDRATDEPQAIFESLNSTGKELSQSDLIRNFILMGLEKNRQESLYEKQWRPMEILFGHENQEIQMDAFFRDYLTLKIGRIPRESEVYDEFKIYHINSEFGNNEDLAADLYRYAKIFTNITFATHPEADIQVLYKDIKALNMNVANPLLLFVSRDFEDGVICKDDYVEIVKLCISYVLRRSICKIPTNSLNKTFATMKSHIRKSDYLNSVKAFFVLKCDDYKEFPSDKEFKKAFVSIELYKMRNRNFILDHLENYDNKSPVVIENLTIEHIMPQNESLRVEWQKMLGDDWKRIHEQYIHTIGNLTLTGYNSEMSDKPFLEKMEMEGGFKQTAVRLNKYVVRQTEWTETQICERANQLADRAVAIWQYPVLSEAEIAPYIEQDTRGRQKYTEDSYKFNALTRMLYQKLDTRILNLSASVKKEYLKKYIAYKLETNFVDIVIQDSQLRLSVNMKFPDVDDPKQICKDVTGLGKWGNGDVDIAYTSLAQIDDVMYIIQQAFNKQVED